MWSTIETFLGLHADAKELLWYQISLRAVVIYLAGLFIIRISDKRFLGRHTAFDAFLAFVLGAMLSRAINGPERLVESIVGGIVLIGLHWLFSIASYKSTSFGTLIKGVP